MTPICTCVFVYVCVCVCLNVSSKIPLKCLSSPPKHKQQIGSSKVLFLLRKDWCFWCQHQSNRWMSLYPIAIFLKLEYMHGNVHLKPAK